MRSRTSGFLLRLNSRVLAAGNGAQDYEGFAASQYGIGKRNVHVVMGNVMGNVMLPGMPYRGHIPSGFS